MNKLKIIDEFNKRCLACHSCKLREHAKQVVPGAGNPDADIMFIGEGPGEKEDELGVPFVGRAGNFLDELLESIKLKREDVFIANMVKCRPPNNRDPEDDEIIACRPWLDEQIEIIDPKVIVPLGRFAMNKFIKDAKISRDHGRAFKIGERIYFIMYHPAVALYNGSMREVLFKDIMKLEKIIEGNYVEKEKEGEGIESLVRGLDLSEVDLESPTGNGSHVKNVGDEGQEQLGLEL